LRKSADFFLPKIGENCDHKFDPGDFSCTPGSIEVVDGHLGVFGVGELDEAEPALLQLDLRQLTVPAARIEPTFGATFRCRYPNFRPLICRQNQQNVDNLSPFFEIVTPFFCFQNALGYSWRCILL
jgi:hypothetical protein